MKKRSISSRLGIAFLLVFAVAFGFNIYSNVNGEFFLKRSKALAQNTSYWWSTPYGTSSQEYGTKTEHPVIYQYYTGGSTSSGSGSSTTATATGGFTFTISQTPSGAYTYTQGYSETYSSSSGTTFNFVLEYGAVTRCSGYPTVYYCNLSATEYMPHSLSSHPDPAFHTGYYTSY